MGVMSRRYDLSSPEASETMTECPRSERGPLVISLWTEDVRASTTCGIRNRARGPRCMAQRWGRSRLQLDEFCLAPIKKPRLQRTAVHSTPTRPWMTLPRCSSDEGIAAIRHWRTPPPSSRRHREGGLVTAGTRIANL